MTAPAVLDTLREAAPAALDSAALGAHGHPEAFEFGHLFDHIKDSNELEIPFGKIELPHLPTIHVAGVDFDLSITKHVIFVLLSAVVVAALALSSARAYRRSLVPKGFANAVEVIVVFVRDEIVLPNMGPGGLRYLPYLLTVFFFVLVMNLMGLIPFGSSATGNIAVTGGMAIISFIMIQVAAIRSMGLAHYLAELTGGVPWFLWPIMVPVEILSLFTKPFALCIRLFANMTGGHLVILSLIGMIFLFGSYLVPPLTLAFVLGINLLEIFVAFLQAYIFTILTALFMGLGILAGGEAKEHAHTSGD